MQKSRRLVFFHSELDTLNLFSNQLKQEFENLGYETFEFDLAQSALSLGLLYDFIQDGGVTAMIGFNMPFFGMQLPSGEKVWEVLDIPCINILVDHPYWYHNLLMRTPRTGIVLSIDRNHSHYIERFYPGIPCTGFLPHGGTPMHNSPKPITKRDIDVLYAGSLFADYAISQKPDFSLFHFPAEQICKNSIDYLLAHPDNTIESVIEEQLLRCGINLPDQELRVFISSCVYIERVVSSYYREKIVSSVAMAGIPLTIYGDGWAGRDWINRPNVHYGGRISPEEVLVKMEDSKIVLNTMPWFKDGSHERIFNAMLRGAVVVSETSSYLKETLPADTWVSFKLSPKDLANLPQRISNLLSNNHAMQTTASAGYQHAFTNHTWQARAQELHRDLLSLL